MTNPDWLVKFKQVPSGETNVSQVLRMLAFECFSIYSSGFCTSESLVGAF